MGSVYKRGKIWWIAYYRDGVKMRESAETEKETVARTLLKSREGDVVRGLPVSPKMSRMTFGELAADVVTDYQINGRRSLKHLNIRLTKHILPVLGKRRASSITGAEIKKFVAKRQGEGASNGEINRELGHIRRGFVLGVQNGKILTRPHIAMLKESNVRTGFFEWEQFLALLRHLPSGLHGPVTFAYITGWRIYSEILPLQWRHVDFAAGRVRLDAGTTKNDDAREFPMTRQLRELLERLKADHEALAKEGRICPWVFQRKGKPIKGFRKAWKSATKDAGIPGRLLHDFRRTAVRNLVRAGIPERVAMTMTGHKTRSVFERYNIVSEGDLLAAAERLEKATGTIPGTTAAEAKTEKAVSSSISTMRP